MCTSGSGILGAPDADALARFVTKAKIMDPRAVTVALATRLQEATTCWQIRSKTLVLVCTLVESPTLAPSFLSLIQDHETLLPRIEALYRTDHNHIVRENARKALSLVLTNGANALHIAKETSSPRSPHSGRHIHGNGNNTTLASVRKGNVMAKPQARNPTAATIKTQTAPPPATIKVNIARSPRQQSLQVRAEDQASISPKIARAALASWRRRMSQNEVGSAKNNPHLLPFQTPAMLAMAMAAGSGGTSRSGNITTSSNASATRYESGQLSAFTFINI